MPLTPETRLGPYEIRSLLGSGGMGEVYLAHDTRLGRNVAVKVLPEQFAHSADRLARFEREARAAGALSHPNVLTVFDVGSQDGIHYLVSELLDGETLQSLLRFERPGLRQSLLWALEIARGLTCAHQAGILHRDLKPENLFLTREGPLKILDFGLAKLVQPEDGAPSLASTATRDTEAGRVLGTAAYMSPEQIRDEPLDGRSDIFALGAILYELLSQRPAFKGTNRSDVMASVLRDEPPALAEAGVVAPAGVEAIVRRCLAKRRENRFGSARELAIALEAVSGAESDVALLGPTRRRLLRPARQSWVAALALIAIGGGLLLLNRWRANSPAPGALAVMYFENLSDRTDADNLGRMLSGLVTTDLASSEGLQVVSSQRLHDITRQLGKAQGDPDPTVATDVARRAGVSSMVLGQVTRAGTRMVATAELVEVASGHRLGSYRVEGMSPQDIFSMAEGLGAQLRARVSGRQAPPGGGVSLTRQLTASVDAYRAYVRGESFFHRMELEKAEAELREAVRLDPEFALAYYRLSIVVGNWGRSVPEARAPAERAAALKDRLSPTDRDIVQGNVLYQTGRLSDAIALFESALARDPGHKEGLYLLSLCYLQSPRDADPRRAIELMERLLAIDPEYHAIYTELALSYVLLGDFATAHARLDGWEAKEPEQVRTRRALLSAWEGRLDEALKWSEASEEASNVWWRSMYALAADRFDLARSLIEKHEQGAGNLNEGMRWVQPFLHASTGQFGPAEAAFRKSLPTQLESDDFASLQAVTLHALAELRMLKGDLKAAQREAERALMIQPEGPFCLYFAGLVASQAGDFRGAERHLATLQAVTKVARGPLVPYYRDALVAEVALARGHPEVARPLLENAVRSDKLLYEAWRGFFPRPLFCDGLARIYLASGEKPKAALALEALLASEWERIFHPAVYIRALYTLGMLKLDVGDRAVGRELLQKFLMHWGKADWDLKEVRDAQARLTIF